jgi:hypothetical protein
MNTIEKVAIDRYLSDQSLPAHKRMDASNYIDWARLGAKEAQRWIQIEEEMPINDGCRILVRNDGCFPIISTAIFKGDEFHADFSLCTEDITHWRPIERS